MGIGHEDEAVAAFGNGSGDFFEAAFYVWKRKGREVAESGGILFFEV